MFPIIAQRLIGDVRDAAEFIFGRVEVVDPIRVDNHGTQKVEKIRDRFEWIVDFMCDRRRHPASRRNLLGLQQGLFEPLASRDIAEYLRRSNDVSQFVFTGDTVRDTSSKRPSFVSRTVSKCLTRCPARMLSMMVFSSECRCLGMSLRIDEPIISSAE
jgi:hypothetical protein